MRIFKLVWLLFLGFLLVIAVSYVKADTVKYTYDGAGRLIQADYGGTRINYTYDQNGNLLKREYQTSRGQESTLHVGISPLNRGSVAGQNIDCPGDCSQVFNEGTNVQLTAKGGMGSRFVGWGGDLSGSGNPLNIVMDTSKYVIAYFAARHGMTDNDGVGDTEEMGPYGDDPFYDGDGNGVPDYQESRVASFRTNAGGGYATLSVPAGLSFRHVQAVGNPLPGHGPAGVNFPYDFFRFTVTKAGHGGRTTVTLHLPREASINGYYNYGPTPDHPIPHWYEFAYDGETGAEIFHETRETRIVLHLWDGKRGDHDLAENGRIIEFGGPGVKPAGKQQSGLSLWEMILWMGMIGIGAFYSPRKAAHILRILLVIAVVWCSTMSAETIQASEDRSLPGVYTYPGDGHFGVTPIGQVSQVKTFTIYNKTGYSIGFAEIGIFTDWNFSQLSFEFVIKNNTCPMGSQSLPLDHGEYCLIDIVLSPTSPGKKTGVLFLLGVYSSPEENPPHNTVSSGATLTGYYIGKKVTVAKNAGQIGEPISTSVGEYSFEKPLFGLGGPLPLELDLSYASWMRTGKIGGDNDLFGMDWAHNYHLTLVRWSPDDIGIQYGPGDLIQFQKSGGAWQVVGEEIIYQLKEDDVGSGHYYLMDPIQARVYTFEKDLFHSTGILTRIEDRNGNALAFTNDSAGRILRIEDRLGRALVFTYSTPAEPGDTSYLTQVADQTGLAVKFDYEDSSGNLQTITDALGHTTTFTYTGTPTDNVMTAQTLPRGNTPYQQSYERDPLDWGWRAVSQTDAYGNSAKLAFDDAHSQTGITDPSGKTYRHTHQDQRLLTGWTDQAGKNITLGYDAQGRRTAVTDRLGDTTRMTYHSATGKIASYTDAEGNTTAYSYAAQDQTFTPAGTGVTFTFYNLARVTHPDNSYEDFVCDSHGNLTIYTDRAGGKRGYQYNTRGQATRVTNATAGVTDSTYNADGTLASSTDSDVGVTTYTYDSHKRPSTITRPGGNTTQMTHDLNGRLLTVTDGLGRTTTYGYDANDNLAAETNALNQTTTYTYDLMDRLVSRTDPLGHSDTYGYDASGRLVSFKNRNGYAVTYAYDARGRQTGVTNPAGYTWISAYDDEGVLAASTTPLGFTTHFQTNKLGLTTAITDPLGVLTRYAYDVAGRLISTTDRSGRTTTFTYDGEGRLLGATKPVIGLAAYGRNGIGMLTRITDPSGKDWDFGYTPMGRRTSHTDPLGNQWTYTNDSQGRLSQITYPGGGTAAYTYDAANQVTRIAYTGGPTLNRTYDAAGRLVTTDNLVLTRDGNGDIINNQDGAASFGASYDSDQRLKTITYDGQATVTYTYDNRDLMARVEDNRTGAWMQFSYDSDSRLTQITRSNGVNTTYGYDNAGRVTRIQDGPSTGSGLADQQYTLSAEGEPTQVVRNLPLSPPLTVSPLNLTYNNASQISNPGYSYDARGRQVAAPGKIFGFDGADRLTTVTSGTDTVSLTYNGSGEVRTRTAGGVTTTYYYNHALAMAPIIAEKGGSAYKYFYVYSPGGGLLYSIDALTGSACFYHFDRLGSTLFLTDAKGSVSDAYSYDPYGNTLGHTGSSDQPFTYVGQFGVRREPVGNLYDMRARYYDPATGRFLTRDPVPPVLEDLQSLNPYQYAFQNSLRHIDPLGLRPPREERRPSQRQPPQKREATFKIIVKGANDVIEVLNITGDYLDNTKDLVELLAEFANNMNWIKAAEKLTDLAGKIGKASLVLQGGIAVLDASLQTFVFATQGAAGHYKAYYDAPGARAVRWIEGQSPEEAVRQVQRDMKAEWSDYTRWGHEAGKAAYKAYEWGAQTYEWIVNFFK